MAALALAPGLRAQTSAAGDSAPGAVVTAIAVEPAPGRTAAHYRSFIQQKLGVPLDRAAVQQSLRTLYGTGEFDQIAAVTEPAAGGLRLLFRTRPNYFLSLIRAQGSPDPPANSELVDAAGLSLGQVYEADAVARAKAAIEARLHSDGYDQAQVSTQVRLDPGQATAAVVFTVAAGPLARLGAIGFQGSLAASPAQLLRVSKLKTGEAYTRARMDQATGRLQAFYRRQGRLTANITVAAGAYDARQNRLPLQFTVVAGPVVTIDTQGMRLDPSVLRDQVPVYQEHAVDSSLVEEGRRNLVQYLQGRGYFEAQVQYRRSTTPGGDLHIVYSIQPGPKESLEHIVFTGNRYFQAADLMQHVSIRTASPWLGALPGARGRFSSAQAQSDAAALEQLYRRNGFEQVAVSPELERDRRGRGWRVTVVFHIDEGPQTLVRNRRIAGASPQQLAALQELVETQPGQPFSAAAVAADRNAILSYYFDHGYQDATCQAEVTPVDAGAGTENDVAFIIDAGERLRVHRVLIAGERDVRRNVIADRVALRPGASLSQSDMLATQSRLYDTGLFTGVQVATRNPDGSEPDKDVLVTVQEARRWTFSEGVGLQIQSGTGGAPNLRDVLGHTGFSPLFSFDVTRTAVGGRAQTLSFRSTYGTLQKRAVLGYTFSDFLHHASLRTGGTAFYDDTYDVRTFRAIREQAGWQLEQSLQPGEGWTYGLNWQRVRVLSPLVAPAEVGLLSQPVQMGEFSATYTLDHRDNPLDTHRGVYDSIEWSLTKTFQPQFASFGRLDWQTHWYRPLGREGSVVLAGSTQFGVEAPFGRRQLITLTNPVDGTQATQTRFIVPLAERFLSGGPDSLRGFSINQAGPRDPITGFPVGGEALLVNNLELRFPLLGPRVGGVAFYDLGNVYSSLGQMLHALARWSPPSAHLPSTAGSALLDTSSDFTAHTAGFGLRYQTPVGPIRVDFGFLLNPPTFHYFSTGPQPRVLSERLPRFHFFFSIGQTF